MIDWVKNTLEKEMAEVKNAARLEAEQQKRRLDEMETNMVNMQAQMQAFMNVQMQAFMNTNKLLYYTVAAAVLHCCCCLCTVYVLLIGCLIA
ncbi:hypothetical protein LINPERHAP2_LOCUS3413 [Linum perenne]